CTDSVDADLEKVILRLLDKSLQERIASAEELVRLLGFHGRPEEVLSEDRPRAARPAQRETIDRQLARSIRWRKIVLGVILAIYLFPSGVITTGMLIAGLWLFFKAQTEDTWSRLRRYAALAAALAILAVVTVGRFFTLNEPTLLLMFVVPHLESGLKRFIATRVVFLFMALGVLQVLAYVLPIFAAALYVSLRRRQREKVLRDATLQCGSGSDEYLDLLRRSLDFRFADVGFHLKYAEALVARG